MNLTGIRLLRITLGFQFGSLGRELLVKRSCSLVMLGINFLRSCLLFRAELCAYAPTAVPTVGLLSTSDAADDEASLMPDCQQLVH